MRRGKRLAAALLAGTLLLGQAPAAPAAEAAFKTVFQDAFYGGLTGALVGGAVLAFDHDAQSKLIYVVYGAAAGVLVGTAWGLATAPRSLASLEGGALRLAVPTPLPALAPGAGGRPVLLVRAELFRARF